jgi:hypothetical protein
MKFTSYISSQLKAVYFGGNWTYSNLKDTLEGVTWQQANTKVEGFNTILALVYHIHYFVNVLNLVLEGKPLDAHDKFSFDHPEITSQEEWKQFMYDVFKMAETLALHIDELPDEKLHDIFVLEKYGSYYRNLTGVIEHTHYHLGQIVIIKKLID